MTPSKQAKELGFKSIAQVQDELGFKSNGDHIVSGQTLNNWSKDKPELLDAVLVGVAAKLGLVT
mgnify:FL=1